MRVIVAHWSGRREVELGQALTPELGYHEGGAVEQAQDLADKLARTLGDLLATLVTERTLTLEQAKDIAGISAELISVED